MIVRIEWRLATGYASAMRTAVLRLVALIVLLLMPLGMSAAPAAAHHAPAMATMQHCPDQGSKHDPRGSEGECTMACSSALPAADLAPMRCLATSRTPAEPLVARVLSGIELEIATPPPRRS